MVTSAKISTGSPRQTIKILKKHETPALRAGEEYFKLFEWLISSFEANFDSTILQTPTDRVGSANKIEPVRACHSSIEPLFCFEAEPA